MAEIESLRQIVRDGVVDLWRTVAAVNNQISPSRVGRGIRGQVEVGTLQLMSLAFTAHGDLVAPDVFGFFGDEA